MYSVVPTSAAPPAKEDFHELLASAKATADAVSPYLTVRHPDGSTSACTIEKVVSCRHFYSALLRSDGTLLLLRQTSEHPGATASPAMCAACVSVLESGGEAVQDVAAGDCHIVYCTVSGGVYSCGYDNTYGQLGDGTVWSAQTPPPRQGALSRDATTPPLSAPKRIDGFGDLRLLESGATASAEDEKTLLTEGADGAAPRVGAAALSSADAPLNSSARHGARPSSGRYVPPPCSQRIRRVACGASHTLLLTHSGRCVYGCGRGDRGELGGARAVLLQPFFRSIALLFGLGVRQVAAADAHSFALLENGLLYAFGDNVCGQLGLGHTKRVLQPTLVPLYGQEAPAERRAMQSGEAQRRNQKASSTNATGGGVGTPSVRLDEKAYASLRAPYASAQSTYYPLRVPRLQADRVDVRLAAGKNHGIASSSSTVAAADLSDDAQVRWVHCGGSWTLLETSRSDVWLSCGAALTRGVPTVANSNAPSFTAPGFGIDAARHATGAPAHQTRPIPRIDGCGVLGRPLQSGDRDEAHRFLPVRWAAAVGVMGGGRDWEVQATPPRWARGELPLKGGPGRSSDAAEFGNAGDRCTSTHAEQSSPTGPAAASFATQPGAVSSDLPLSPRRTSDTELSLCHTKKTMKVEDGGDGVRVRPYPTTLLMALGDDEEGESWSAAGAGAGAGQPRGGSRNGAVTSRLLVQSGAPAATAITVPTRDASAWELVRGVAVEADEAVPSTVEATAADCTPCGASVLRLPSLHGQLLPLRTYALVL